MSNLPHLILASSSPRRKELLTSAGVTFKIVVPDICEDGVPGESPQMCVRRLAALKAEAVAKQFPEAWVLGADTIVYLQNEVLNKPRDTGEAKEMLQKIQGRTHSVWGGFALINMKKGVHHIEAHETLVTISPLNAKQIERYVASGEPMDKAGAYAAQGLASQFIHAISGSYTNVVGLNLAATMSALREYKVIE